MKREIIEILYREAVDSCVEQHKNLDHAIAWAWEEKFAELIVKKCIKLMGDAALDAEEFTTYMGEDVPTSVHICNIKNHFGVT